MPLTALPLTVMLLTLLAACGKDAPTDDTGAAGDGGAADGGADGGGDGGSVQTQDAIVAQAEVTWTLDFDAEAEALGYADCSYGRSYEGVQRLDRGYLCPDCAVIVRGSAALTDGADCLAYISEVEEEREETWGWSADGRLFRSSLVDYPLGELATFDAGASSGAALAWESEYTLTEGGTMLLSAAGTLSWAADPSVQVEEPFPPQTRPYACGWPTNDPGDLPLDYAPAIGDTFPNVRLVDQCGEEVNLWDLYGTWLVMDTSQPDCGPCLNMASTAGEFVEEMAAQGIDVRVLSFLGNGLADPFSSPEPSVYDSFVASYDHGDPIFVDEGFGYSVFSRLAETELGEEFGFPTWVVVDPTMTLVAGNVGFGDWDAVAEIIAGGG